MRFIACMLFMTAISIAEPSTAQSYQYNDRVTTQSYRSESFLKSNDYKDGFSSQSFKSQSFLKPSTYGDRSMRGSFKPQNYRQKSLKQQSFLPQEGDSLDNNNKPKPTKHAPVMPLKPVADNSNTGSIKQGPKLKTKDFTAPKTDGGYTPFDRYEVAVPEAPKLKNN